MYVEVQPTLPDCAPEALSARLTILHTKSGATSVHWKVETVLTSEPVAIGAKLCSTHQDAVAVATDVLVELLRVLPTLVDSDPF